MTRFSRAVKPRPEEWIKDLGFTFFTLEGCVSGRGIYEGNACEKNNIKLPYKPGDVLFVKETWRLVDFSYIDGEWSASVQYKDGSVGTRLHFGEDGAGQKIGWRPSVHMPREAARLFLRVAAVKVQRVQDIAEDEAKAEGFDSISAFRNYWDRESMRKRGADWYTNEWIFAYAFERISKDEIQHYAISGGGKTDGT
jgi:hypothetical protein